MFKRGRPNVPNEAFITNISIRKHTENNESLIYTGSTQQAATQDASINIALAHIDSGTNTAIPQITRILRPSAVASLASAEISITINGNAGELLQYQLIDESTNAPSGSLTPISGSVQLPNGSSTSTIVLNYTAPDATQFATLPHTSPYTFKVTNADGNSVSSSFSLDIVSDGINHGVHTTFNPTILGVSGQRNGSLVTWEVDADTAGEAAYIEYLWDFSTTSSASMFSIADQNPGTMDTYDETVEGTINLQVTDTSINGGVTNYSYALIAGQFPDTVTIDPADIKIANTMTPATISIDGSPANLATPIEVKRSSNNEGMRLLDLGFDHPVKGDGVYLHNSIEYSWTLDTPNMPAGLGYTPPTTDSLFSNASGSADLTAGAASLSTTMTLPFVLEQQVVNLRLTIKGYSDTGFTTLIETTEVVYPLILDPAWERLQNNNNDDRCLNANTLAATNVAFSPCNEPGTLWSFHPINGLMYSKTRVAAGDANLCLYAGGSPFAFSCNATDGDLRYYFGPWNDVFASGDGWFSLNGDQIADANGILTNNAGNAQMASERNFNWVID
jgi:hypothetical protein